MAIINTYFNQSSNGAYYGCIQIENNKGEKLKFEVVGNPIEMKQSMKADNYAQAKELAKAMAERLLGTKA